MQSNNTALYHIVFVANTHLDTDGVDFGDYIREQIEDILKPINEGLYFTTLARHSAYAFQVSFTTKWNIFAPVYAKINTIFQGQMLDICLIPDVNRKKALLLCDMDSTIIGQECLDELADFAGFKAEVQAITERAMAGELDFEDALRMRVKMLEGLRVSAINECINQRISLNPGARILVKTMSGNGAKCVLVSGGFTHFTQVIAKQAGFHAHHGNQLDVSAEHLSGMVSTPILGREAKLGFLHHYCSQIGIDSAEVIAIGDGANDLAMLQAAGMGIAYYAKPVVNSNTDFSIAHTDLSSALFYQGYHEDDFID